MANQQGANARPPFIMTLLSKLATRLLQLQKACHSLQTPEGVIRYKL
jgi:hypothetical protein